jgi:hypothetical protein
MRWPALNSMLQNWSSSAPLTHSLLSELHSVLTVEAISRSFSLKCMPATPRAHHVSRMGLDEAADKESGTTSRYQINVQNKCALDAAAPCRILEWIAIVDWQLVDNICISKLGTDGRPATIERSRAELHNSRRWQIAIPILRGFRLIELDPLPT